MDKKFTTLILAAGMGKRMESDLPKVLHQLDNKALVEYVIDLARGVGSDRIILIIGHKRELVQEQTRLLDVEYAVQAEQNGTGHAVSMCKDMLKDYDGDVLVLSGDVPLLTEQSVREALEVHQETDAAATVFTFAPEDPFGYGRIIRGETGEVLGIVEQKDATDQQKAIGEVNGGIYFFKSAPLWEALSKVSNKNASGEYYITDTVGLMRAEKHRVSAYLVKDPMEMSGVNSKPQLAELEKYFLERRKR